NLDVQGDLERPARVGRWVVGAAVLVYLLEAWHLRGCDGHTRHTVRERWHAHRADIGIQVGPNVRVIEGVDDGHDPATRDGVLQTVCGAELAGPEPIRAGPRLRPALVVGDYPCVAADRIRPAGHTHRDVTRPYRSLG